MAGIVDVKTPRSYDAGFKKAFSIEPSLSHAPPMLENASIIDDQQGQLADDSHAPRRS